MNFIPDSTKTQFEEPPHNYYNSPTARFIRAHFRLDGNPLLLVMAVVLGVCAGVAAWIFKAAIGGMSSLVFHHVSIHGGNPWLIALPLVGICLSGLFMRKVLKVNISDGTNQIRQGLRNGRYYLRFRRIWAPLAAATVTLGLGGSAGSEGPIASSGAAIGSSLGRIFGVDLSTQKLLVAIGAGAGIAAIFKAPVGGMFFTIECLTMTLSFISAVALGISCLCAGMTAYFLSGGTTDLNYTGTIPFDAGMLPAVALLGVFCGLYSIYYRRVMEFTARKLEGMSHPWLRNIVAGLSVGILIFLFPSLYGEGYSALGAVVNGNDSTVILGSPMAVTIKAGITIGPLLAVTGCILLAKCWACGCTVHGGGVAGEFAPTLFAGGMAGLFFALAARLIPGVEISPALFALFGMAGAMAGIIRAPLMAIFICAEMTGSYDSLLPVSICAGVSFATVWAWRRYRNPIRRASSTAPQSPAASADLHEKKE